MRCKFVIGLVLASTLYWAGGSARAEESSDRPKESATPILDRFDNFVRKVFSPRDDGRERPKSAKSSSPRVRVEEEPSASRSGDRPYAPRAGSVLGTAVRDNREPSATVPLLAAPDFSAPGMRDSSQRFVHSNQVEEAAASRPDDKEPPAVSGMVPIHERLANFRQSLFGKSGSGIAESPADAKNSPTVSDKPDRALGDVAPPAGGNLSGEPPRSARVLVERPAVESLGTVPGAARERVAEPPMASPAVPETRVVVTPADRIVRRQPVGREPTASITPTPASAGPSLGQPAVSLRRGVAPETGPQSAANTSAPAGEATTAPGVMNSAARVSESASSAAAVPGNKHDDPEPGPASGDSPGAAVFSAESPAVSVETSGPRRIVVGKEGTYEVVVRNRSAVAAEQVVVSVDLPQWTEVSGSETSVGAVATGRTTTQQGQVRWTLARLEPQGAERLTLRVVPRQSRPFDLLARVDYAPPKSRATIEVQEAKLGITLHGPREVLFGKSEVYKLEISNTGTADAENVMVTLAPSAPGERLAAATHRFGTLSAGQKKTVAMELTARQDGNLSIAIEARADGGIKAQAAQEIVVRRAKLTADVGAPKVVFSGNEMTYRIRVRNQGSAPANHVKVQAILPPGAKYVSGSQDAALAPNEPKVLWTVDRIGAGSEATFALTCAMSGSGASRLEVRCDAEGDEPTTMSVVTRVETSPKLALTVEEPSGPVGLEGEAVYQIRLQNRGTANAKDVEVVVYFANNLEPISAAGGHHKLGAGQVVFDPLPALAPGQDATFQVKAKAGAAGNHVFRVEVHSAATGARLVREGTTRFYAADAPVDPPALAQPAHRDAARSADEVRTADRRNAVAPQGESRSSDGTQR